MWLIGSLLLSLLLASSVQAVTPTSIDASWTEPTTKTDGSALNDLANYRVYYSTNQSNLTPCQSAATVAVVNAPLSTPPLNHTLGTTLNNLSSSTTYFASVTAVNTSGLESACSPIASLATLAAQPPLNVTNPSVTFQKNPMAVAKTGSPANAAQATTNSLTYSYTVAADADALVVDVGILDNSALVGTVTVTYNGVSMTQSVTQTQSGFFRASKFTLAAPATGAHNVVVTLSKTEDGVASGAQGYKGVDQVSPVSNTNTATGNSTAPAITVTSAVGEWASDCVVAGSTLSAPTKTQDWLQTGSIIEAGGSDATGAASVTFGWTVTPADLWVEVALSLRASTATSSIGSSPTAFHPGKGPTFARFFQPPRGTALSPDIAAGQGSVSTPFHPGARPTRGAPGVFFQKTQGFTFDLSLLTPPAGQGSVSTNIHPGASPGTGRFFQTKGGITAVATAGPTPVGQALETDVSQPVTHLKTLAVGQALETDVAQPIVANKAITVTQPIETDIAQPIGRLKTKLVGQAVETDIAQAVTRNKALTLTQPIETDIAQPVAWNPKNRFVNQAIETDIAQPVTGVLSSGATTLLRIKRKRWFRSGS